jgi:hypothetical protein
VPSGVTATVHAANTAAGKIQNPSSRFALWLILAVVVVAAGYFAIDKFVASKHVGEAARTSATAVQPLSPTRSTIPEKSIAVLPFIDLSEKSSGLGIAHRNCRRRRPTGNAVRASPERGAAPGMTQEI